MWVISNLIFLVVVLLILRVLVVGGFQNFVLRFNLPLLGFEGYTAILFCSSILIIRDL